MGDTIHKLVLRQLKSLGLTLEAPPKDEAEWKDLLAKMSRLVEEAENQSYLLERSLDISSREMQTRWEEMKIVEEQWRSLAECAPDLIFMTDPQGQVLFSNRGKGAFTKEQLVGRSLPDVYPTENQKDLKEIIQEVVTSRSRKSRDVMSLRAPSTESWLSVRAAPILRGDNLVALVVVESDITEVHRVAQEVEARKKAEAIAETKSRFLANMSHEIRTPLNGILGMTHLLNDRISDPETKDKVRLIQLSGQTLLSIVNDILDFSKIEAGKLDLESTPIDMHHCFEGLVQLFASKAAEKGITLTSSISPTSPKWIKSDPLKIRQTLLNLIGNALKFTEKGSVHVSASATPSQNGKCNLRFSVRDTGMGISAEGINRLFIPFSQVDGGTTRKFGGTGLGLSISKGLVERMGGTIGVTSTVGHGSDFHFTLPVEVVDAPPVVTEVTSVPVHSSIANEFPLRILLAEDNSVNQVVAAAFLKKLGYSVDIVENGRLAIEALEKKSYDLILMDCHMPVLDGFGASEEICRRWPNQHPTIIAVTASTLEEDRRACFKAGMEGVVPKPITVEALAQVIRTTHAKSMSAANARPPFTLEGKLLVDNEKLEKHFKQMQDILIPAISTYLSSLHGFA